MDDAIFYMLNIFATCLSRVFLRSMLRDYVKKRSGAERSMCLSFCLRHRQAPCPQGCVQWSVLAPCLGLGCIGVGPWWRAGDAGVKVGLTAGFLSGGQCGFVFLAVS